MNSSRHDSMKRGAHAARVPSAPARRRLLASDLRSNQWVPRGFPHECVRRAAEHGRPAACTPRTNCIVGEETATVLSANITASGEGFGARLRRSVLPHFSFFIFHFSFTR